MSLDDAMFQLRQSRQNQKLKDELLDAKQELERLQHKLNAIQAILDPDRSEHENDYHDTTHAEWQAAQERDECDANDPYAGPGRASYE